jgi:amino acid transporter
MAMRRSVGVTGLTFIAIGGMIGSGWLFAPLQVVSQAGPASVISWLIGGVAVLLLALAFAEICGLLPVAGGIARIPHFSHGNVVSAAMGWTAWVGYVTTAPIETAVMLNYLGIEVPGLDHVGGVAKAELTSLGLLAAAGVMVLIVVVNAIGVRALAATNTALTWVKIALPLLISGLFLADTFHGANFTQATGGFAPDGLRGILAGVSTGGVIFAFIGFRHAIDLAGEAHNPQVTVPVALTLSVVVTTVVYLAMQVAFIGAVPPDQLGDGWAKLQLGHKFGPLAALATGLGFVWLGATIFGGAIVSPLGGALVAAGSNARLALALSQNGFFPSLFQRLSAVGVPLLALILNAVVGFALLVGLPFERMLELNEASLTLSFCVGPLCLLALRRQLASHVRGFRVPGAVPVAVLGFTVASCIVYWTGWHTNLHLFAALAIGAVLFLALRYSSPPAARPALDLRPAVWLVPYLIGLALISWLGGFDGGLGVLPFGWDLLCLFGLSAAILALGLAVRLPDDQVLRYIAEDKALQGEEAA